MVKLIWRLAGDLIYDVFSIEIPDNLQIKLPLNLHKRYNSPHCLYKIAILTILVIRYTMFSLSKRQKNYIIFPYHGENRIFSVILDTIIANRPALLQNLNYSYFIASKTRTSRRVMVKNNSFVQHCSITDILNIKLL